jgi:integrase
MTIETVGDAISVAKVLYRGRDIHFPVKLDWWCQQLGPEKQFLALTTDDVDAGIRVLIEEPKIHFSRDIGRHPGRRLRAAGTINKYIAALGSMYKLLRLHRRLPRSFVSPIVKGLLLPLPQGRTLQVTIEDVHKLVAAARLSNNRKLSALLAVACTTGLRKGSLQSISWGDVDLKERTIDVGRTKNGTPCRSLLPRWAATELNRIRPENPEKEMLVFGPSEFKKAWVNTLARAELPEEWTFHHTRHIAASILAQSGASLPVIMQALNHKSPSMALRYSHVNTKALDIAITNAWN